MRYCWPVVFFLTVTAQVVAQPNINWSRVLGGVSNEYIADITSCSDGGILALCKAFVNSNDVDCDFNGSADVWVVRLDGTGSILWQNCFGGTQDETPYQIICTADGGFLFTAITNSTDGDITFNHSSTNGNYDIWVVKCDSSGLLQWQQCIGGTGYELPDFVMQLSNGKYLLSARTFSNDGDFPLHYGALAYDAWIATISPNGSLDTAMSYSGSSDDVISEVHELPNGDRMHFGYSSSGDFGLVGLPQFGNNDGWLLETDSSGAILWQSKWGGTGGDGFVSAASLDNGDFLVLGNSWSTNGTFSANHGGTDLWLTRVDSMGSVTWQKFFGGSSNDVVDREQRLLKVNGNLFCIGARSTSSDGDVAMNYGYDDFWFLALDSAGGFVTNNVFGGSSYDYLYSALLLGEQPYLAGAVESNDLDIVNNHGGFDGWIIQISNYTSFNSIVPRTEFQLYPTPGFDQFTCTYNPLLHQGVIEVYDAVGRMQLSVPAWASSTVVSTKSLPAGFYCVKLMSGGKPLAQTRWVKTQ